MSDWTAYLVRCLHFLYSGAILFFLFLFFLRFMILLWYQSANQPLMLLSFVSIEQFPFESNLSLFLYFFECKERFSMCKMYIWVPLKVR